MEVVALHADSEISLELDVIQTDAHVDVAIAHPFSPFPITSREDRAASIALSTASGHRFTLL